MFYNDTGTVHLVTDRDGSARFVVLEREMLEESMEKYAKLFFPNADKIHCRSAEGSVILYVDGKARYYASSISVVPTKPG